MRTSLLERMRNKRECHDLTSKNESDDAARQAATPRRIASTPIDQELAAKLPAAAPCQTCGCPLFWLDPYGGINCGQCLTPPSPRMVRERLMARYEVSDSRARASNI